MSLDFNFTADGNSDEFVAVGDFRMHAENTFGGGTTVIQEKQKDGTFSSLGDSALTATGDSVIELVESGVLRINVVAMLPVIAKSSVKVCVGIVK